MGVLAVEADKFYSESVQIFDPTDGIADVLIWKTLANDAFKHFNGTDFAQSEHRYPGFFTRTLPVSSFKIS